MQHRYQFQHGPYVFLPREIPKLDIALTSAKAYRDLARGNERNLAHIAAREPFDCLVEVNDDLPPVFIENTVRGYYDHRRKRQRNGDEGKQLRPRQVVVAKWDVF